jgi:uncharacterized protein
MDRKDLLFSSGYDSCAAWLYPAAGSADLAPIIVMAHGLSERAATGWGPSRSVSRPGASPRSSSTTAVSETARPDLFDPARQLDDWRAAIAFARSLPGVDAGRVAVFGSSLGGGNALAAAAGDSRVAAAISQVPFLDRDSQTYRASAEVTAQMMAAAAAGGTCPPSGSRTRRRSSVPLTPRPAGAMLLPSARTPAGGIGFQRTGSWGLRTVRSATPLRCTARGWSASPGAIR